MALEDDLRGAVRNGFLHLSLGQLMDGSGWQCTYRTTGTTAVQEVTDRDPVDAMGKALRGGTRVEKAQKPVRRNVEDLA